MTQTVRTLAFHGGPPTMAERSKYQENIIKNYYKNQDTILLQRLG